MRQRRGTWESKSVRLGPLDGEVIHTLTWQHLQIERRGWLGCECLDGKAKRKTAKASDNDFTAWLFQAGSRVCFFGLFPPLLGVVRPVSSLCSVWGGRIVEIEAGSYGRIVIKHGREGDDTSLSLYKSGRKAKARKARRDGARYGHRLSRGAQSGPGGRKAIGNCWAVRSQLPSDQAVFHFGCRQNLLFLWVRDSPYFLIPLFT